MRPISAARIIAGIRSRFNGQSATRREHGSNCVERREANDPADRGAAASADRVISMITTGWHCIDVLAGLAIAAISPMLADQFFAR